MPISNLVVGSFASIAYGESRFTQDIDIIAAFQREIAGIWGVTGHAVDHVEAERWASKRCCLEIWQKIVAKADAPDPDQCHPNATPGVLSIFTKEPCHYLPQVIAIHKSFIELLSKYNVKGGCVASVIAAGSGTFLTNEPASRFPSKGFVTRVSFLVPALSG